MVINQDIYESFGSLQNKGLIKFRQDTPENVLIRIRQIKIQKYSLQKLNMKLKILTQNKREKDNALLQKQDPLIKYFLSYIFVQIEQINFVQLKFYKQSFFSYDKNLLITLGTVKMVNLEYLDLKNCQLGSIQALSFLDFSGLKKLLLNNNNLTNLNAFSKLYLPKLYWLQLSDNEIKDTKGFNRILMSKRIGLLQITQKNSNVNKDSFTYLSLWIFKLPFDHINYVRKTQKYLVLTQSSINKAMKKYPQINFR